MVDVQKHSWWTGAVIGFIAWLCLEMIATMLHIWGMKKAGVCPYMTLIKEKEKAAKQA